MIPGRVVQCNTQRARLVKGASGFRHPDIPSSLPPLPFWRSNAPVRDKDGSRDEEPGAEQGMRVHSRSVERAGLPGIDEHAGDELAGHQDGNGCCCSDPLIANDPGKDEE